VAYYYFDFRDTAKQDVRGLLSSLVSQLCAKSDFCCDILSSLYSQHDAGSQLPDDDLLTQCLEDMLKLPGLPPIYIIIDALDESPNSSGVPSPRELVLKFIVDLVKLRLPNLRLCVTSRPEIDIQQILRPLVTHSVSLHDEAGQRQDITDYINTSVHSDPKMKTWREEERRMVIDVLTQRADGMYAITITVPRRFYSFDPRFRWVFCQLDTLRRCFPIALRQTLDQLPHTLDETYERTLLGIEREKQIYARRLFQCLTVSIRPLRVEELAEVLAVQLDAGQDSEYSTEWSPGDAQQAVLSACSSLIAIVNVNGTQVVQFAHFSVREFLTSNRLLSSSAGGSLSLYHVPLVPAHTVLARACLSVLLSFDDPVDKSAVEKRPLSTYAAQHWVTHAKVEGVSANIQNLMKRLFDPDKPHFATWIWIFDIDRHWKGSMATVHPTQPEARPLYYAALCGFRSIVDHLTITHPMDINAIGGTNGTPMNAAFIKQEVDIARSLLQNGANIDVMDFIGESSLHRGARFGLRAAVKLLLENQANVNIQTRDEDWTPLHLAARAGEVDICRLLLQYGANVGSKVRDGWTPLHLASRNGHLYIVQDLLVHGADPNDQNKDLWTSLHDSALNAGPFKFEIVQLLVRHGAALDKTNADHETPLHVASRCSGNVKIARFLVEKGANTVSRDRDGDTPLHNASRFGNLEIVQILLGGRVDVNARNSDGETPLNLVSSHGNIAVARLLLEHGANVTCRDKQGWTPLHTAARYGHLDIARLLVKLGIAVEVRNVDGNTPLTLSAMSGHVEVSRFLIEQRASVHSVSADGWTALHFVSRFGHADVMQLLLDHGADVHVHKADLWAPLHLASANGYLKVSELLIASGAHVDVFNGEHETPLELASGNGELEVARLLVKSGANVDSQDREGWTPLHSAAWNGHFSLVQMLHESGADIEIRDSNGRTPLDLAFEGEKSDVTKFLSSVHTASAIRLQLEDSLPTVEEEPQLPVEHTLHKATKTGRLDVIQRLLDGGADVSGLDSALRTPLDLASKYGELEIAEILVQYGAEVNTRDYFGRTPLLKATLNGHFHVVRFLLDRGADINAKEREGLTPLHLASINGHYDIVPLLLERGANIRARCLYGKTPSQYASSYGCREIVLLLSDFVSRSGFRAAQSDPSSAFPS
jgi:ankyrin repeat protein